MACYDIVNDYEWMVDLFGDFVTLEWLVMRL